MVAAVAADIAPLPRVVGLIDENKSTGVVISWRAEEGKSSCGRSAAVESIHVDQEALADIDRGCHASIGIKLSRDYVKSPNALCVGFKALVVR